MRSVALLSLRISAWLFLVMGIFAAFNSFIQFQETSQTTSNAIARFIFEGFPFLLAGVAAWAFLLLAIEAFEQIAALYNRSHGSGR